jgi:hypothetical protein
LGQARYAGTAIEEPVFLVGTTRSGTTLLSLMLGHHPEIAFVGELEWVWDFAPLAREPDMGAYCAWLATHRHFLAHRLHVGRSLGFDDLVRSFLAQMRAQADPEARRLHVGCQVHRHYARALETWPRARFIHIVRDGRDVCASWMKLGWLGNAYEGGLRWANAMEDWVRLRERLRPERRIELRFEELILRPERELARLCSFIGTPYSESMLHYHDDTTYGPVDPAQASKWRTQLGVRDVRLFETVAADRLLENGYALSGERPYRLGSWSRLLLRVDDKIRHHRARARVYGTRLWLADILARRLGAQSLRDRVRLALNDVENALIK